MLSGVRAPSKNDRVLARTRAFVPPWTTASGSLDQAFCRVLGFRVRSVFGGC